MEPWSEFVDDLWEKHLPNLKQDGEGVFVYHPKTGSAGDSDNLANDLEAALLKDGLENRQGLTESATANAQDTPGPSLIQASNMEEAEQDEMMEGEEGEGKEEEEGGGEGLERALNDTDRCKCMVLVCLHIYSYCPSVHGCCNLCASICMLVAGMGRLF